MNSKQMRPYMNERRRIMREKVINLLGSKCIRCGSIENLQFDHIDSSSKVATIADMLSHSFDNLMEEIKKCQLLCESCHKLKTHIDLDYSDKDQHGTWTAYKYCTPKCGDCRELKREWTAEYRKTHKRTDC